MRFYNFSNGFASIAIMNRFNIVDSVLVVGAGSIEDVVREMGITYIQVPQSFGDAASAVKFANTLPAHC